MAEEWLLDWHGAARAGAPVCGGKGWNLGRLHRYGFPVPPGGVLVAGAYRRCAAAPGVRERMAALAGVPAGQADDPGVAAALGSLRAALMAQPYTLELEAAVRLFLTAAGLDRRPVAVRSSATAEDGAPASFAGIHESFLNLQGPAAVLAAIRGCYASLWTPRALAYRRRLGLPDDQVACAVVICAMVGSPGGGPPAAAGVAFSCDPRSGRRDQVTISAAPGAGAAVVGGTVNPEEVAVLLEAGRLAVGARRGRPAPVLDDGAALALARLIWRVHWALGAGQDPQDVEWVYDGERFWVLQARPATRVPTPAFPGAAGLPVVWSNANLKDAVAGVLSTLGWSILQGGLRYILFAALAAVGYPLPPGLETVRRFSGRAYFDLTSLAWGFYDAFGLTPAVVNRILGGHQPEIPVPPGNPLRGPGAGRRQRARLRLLLIMWRLVRTYPAGIARAFAGARQFRSVPLGGLSDGELLALVYQVSDLQVEFGPQLGNSALGVWQPLLESLLQRRRPGRAQALAAALMAGGGRVVSAEHGYRLYDLAAAAAADPAARAYLAAPRPDPHGWQHLPADSPFRRAFAAFLDDFGHRAVYEVDISNPRWREDPGYLLAQVQQILGRGGARAPREAAAATRQAAEAELAGLPFWVRWPARWLAARSRGAAALREEGKSAVVALLEPVRRLALEVGRRMAAAGSLDRPEDVFHLSWADAESFLRGEWDGAGAGALANDRARQREAWLQEEPPDVFILDDQGRPAALPAAAPAPGQAAPPAGQPAAMPPGACPSPPAGALVGVGAAAGRATGPARIVRHPAEGHRLQPGDVLVAPSTDPAWTPLFLRAAAVVTEVGGYLSHGAIVAREYGLPCVVNVPGLLQAVQDGDMLTVDGDQGLVLPPAPRA